MREMQNIECEEKQYTFCSCTQLKLTYLFFKVTFYQGSDEVSKSGLYLMPHSTRSEVTQGPYDVP